ncbi:MAG: GTP-binding protein, partial [Pseudomonadota bacterium]|nr:GTP-binding protein [Pseudomonadota bacterium]
MSIPLAILGGYLGAGKTTLVNRLLREPHGARLTVLVNDLGKVNIDAGLIADHDGT